MTIPAGPAGGGTSDSDVEKTRAWTGLYAVIAGDVAIALAAILGITHFATTSTANSQILPQIVAILSSAFTAIGTMTTAYFGIKSMANTAKNLAGPPTGNAATGSRPGSGPGPAQVKVAPQQRRIATRERVAEKQRRLREISRRRRPTIPPR